MTAAADVIRRFEVRSERAPLEELEGILRRAVDEQVQKGQRLAILGLDPIVAPRLMAVRLRGAPGAAARVVKRVTEAGGAILRDLVDVPLEERRPGVFPERQPLLSMPGPGSRAEPPQGDPVVVAIVDSGLHVDHVALRGHVWPDEKGPHGARFMNGTVDHDVTDQDGHGTALAGTILAVAGSVPRVKLMAVKFFDAVTRPAALNAARGIDFAVAHGAHIIDLSWDIGLESDDLRRAIRGALDKGRLVVFAAGNGGSNNDRLKSIPSLYASEGPERAITVMAVTRYGDKAWFSNYGDQKVDLGAPGVAILSTRPYLSKEAASPGARSGASAATAAPRRRRPTSPGRPR